MGFEWDDDKDAANALKHGIGFTAAAEVFDDPACLIEDSSKPEHGELRMRAIGVVQTRLITVIYTERPSGRRIV